MTEPPPPPPPGAGTPPPVRTKKQKQQRRKKPVQRTIWSYVFYLVIIVVVAFGVLQLASSFFADKEPEIGDHIHAALVVDICGVVQENAPEFLQRAGEDRSAGVHSHGDGLMHIHPEADDEVGGDATVGKFFEEGGWELAEDRINLSSGPNSWADIDVSNGQPCPDGRPGTVRLMVNGREEEGDPADFAPDDGDRIILLFLPEGDALPDEQGVIPQDVGGALASALEGQSVDQGVERESDQ